MSLKLRKTINPSLPHLPSVLPAAPLLSPGQEPPGADPDGVADEAVGDDQDHQGEEEIRQTAQQVSGGCSLIP